MAFPLVHLFYFILPITTLLNCVSSDLFIRDLNSPKSSINLCTAECIKKTSSGSNSVGSTESCSRGCRFFAIAQLVVVDGQVLDQNSSREACKNSCHQSYEKGSNDLSSCTYGCDIPQVPQAVIPYVAEISWSVFIDNGDNFEPDDVLMDPTLREQVSKLENLRIPEMTVKTLPVAQMKNEMESGSTWWLGCSSSNLSGRGVPHCLAGSLLLLLLLLALWFGLFLDDSSSPKDTANAPSKDPPSSPPPTYVSFESIKLIPPPAYSELPEYDDPLPQKLPLA